MPFLPLGFCGLKCLPEAWIVIPLPKVAGTASIRFSLTNEVAVYCTNMNLNLVPHYRVRNAGKPWDPGGVTRQSILRSEIAPSWATIIQKRRLSRRPRHWPG